MNQNELRELDDLVAFIEAKVSDAKQSLNFREESEKVWASGTDESWRKAGCFKPKAERLKVSQSHGRIAVKVRLELQRLRGVLQWLNKAQFAKALFSK